MLEDPISKDAGDDQDLATREDTVVPRESIDVAGPTTGCPT